MPDDEDLAVEILPDENLENIADLGPVERHAEHDKVRLLRIQNAGQLTGLTAFAGDEAKILESIGKKGPKVPFAVSDAGPRSYLSMTETYGWCVFLGIELVHARPFQQMRAKSYIRTAVAKKEFSGRGRECFGRVKAAIEDKNVMTDAGIRAVGTASRAERSFVAMMVSSETRVPLQLRQWFIVETR